MFRIERIEAELPQGAVVHKRLAARGIIYDGARLLLVQTKRGDYKFPGGGVREQERPADALRREIQEETGYTDVLVGPCIGTVTEQRADTVYPSSFFRMESLYYVCRLGSRAREGQKPDGYEEELEFHGVFSEVEEAYRANALLQKECTGIPWLERETEVLAELCRGPLARMVLEVFECGKIIRETDRKAVLVDVKEGHANFVTAYDKQVQQELRSRLLSVVPGAVFLGEEEEHHASIEKGIAFIVDPIDGTTNFIKDYHCSCISVGVTKDGRAKAGIVYNPYLDEMFVAERGRGAYCNGVPIHVSRQPLAEGLVLFGTAPYYEKLAEQSFELAFSYFKKALDVRRSGSAAIDLCNIACGRAELYFELLLAPWDYAAGALLVEEAGGKVTTVEGGDISLEHPCSVKATNGIAE